MARFHTTLAFYTILFLFASLLQQKANASDEERKLCIVYMGALPEEKDYSPSSHHAELLQQVSLKQYLVRSYTRSFNGFAAYLTEHERQLLAAHDDVVSVFPSRILQLMTTESWNFVGLPQNVSRSLQAESDVIIGLLDTGVWPESESFQDHGLGPPPKKWKGVCDGGKNFTCNNKIIGARAYAANSTARDTEGHGTHTASTAAGVEVKNTSFFGIAQGTARGAVPSAKLAIYKVCSAIGCAVADILAAFDDAIADGVDILSVSLGTTTAIDLKDDPIAIGAFHAAEKGILTVQSAGNSGEVASSTSSTAPWIFSVAASSTKRQIVTKVSLGNGQNFLGTSVNSFNVSGGNVDLVYGLDAAGNCSEDLASACIEQCLDEKKVKGKIVLCTSPRYSEVSRAGGLGAVVGSDVQTDISFVTPIAATVLTLDQFGLVEKYYNSTKKPKASLFSSQLAENKIAPVLASFSSRGPNLVFQDILKPDITAPGVDILAAFSPEASPSSNSIDNRAANYNILSGTSMACPHVAGASAYLKSFHLDWSPSAIKSALMTTAIPLNATNDPRDRPEFSFGSGFIDPVKAVNPGLVYETLNEDYAKFLCNVNLTDSELSKLFGKNITCSKGTKLQPKDLNYPTLSAAIDTEMKEVSVKFKRTVTNVGVANSTYKANVYFNFSEGNVTVQPDILAFQKLKESKSFVVTVTAGKVNQSLLASLEWSDGVHRVRSPIVVYLKRNSNS